MPGRGEGERGEVTERNKRTAGGGGTDDENAMEVEPTDAELVRMADALDPPPHGKAHEDRMEHDAAMDPPTRQDAAALHVGTREEYPTRPVGAVADPERVRATMQDPGVDAVRPAKRSRMVVGTGPTTSVGVETAAPAAGAGTSLSETDEHDAAVAVSKYGPFPRLVTDEFELLKYLPGLNGLAGAAVLKQRYSILVVRPRTSMPDDAQFHTIEHAAASADRDSILGTSIPPPPSPSRFRRRPPIPLF